MQVQFPPSVVGVKGTLVVLEVDVPSKARRVRVRGFDRLEPLDLKGETRGGTYDVPEGVPRLHVPLRVTRDGAGRGTVGVVLEDVGGAVPPESWEGEIVLLSPPAGVARRQMAWLVGAFALVVAAIVWFVVVPLFREPEVPNVLGKTPEEAERALLALGYLPQRETVPATSDAWVGKVTGQAPSPGTRLAFGDTVTITVARRREPDAVPGVEVGDLAGKSVDEAEKAIEALGLHAVVEFEDADPERVGTVLSQDPPAGARRTAGSPVVLRVGRAREPEARDVPDLVGLARADAEKALAERGLGFSIQEQDAAADQVGRVLRQAPAAGARAQPGVAISLFVGRAPAEPALVPLPDVMGRVRAEAERALADAGFLVSVTEVDAAGNEGKVVGQSPGAGLSPKGVRVELMVGRGAAPAPPPTVPSVEPTPTPPTIPPPPPVEPPPATPPSVPPTLPPTIPPPTEPAPTPPAAPPAEAPPSPTVPSGATSPDVLGLDRAKAEGAVRAAGLAWKTTFEDAGEDVREGVVLGQSPAAGEPVPSGVVELVVSRRAAQGLRTVPDVVGKNEWDAAAALREASLLAKTTYVDASEAQRGIVVSQKPAAGSQAEPRTSIELSVGRGGPTTPPVVPPPTPPAPGRTFDPPTPGTGPATTTPRVTGTDLSSAIEAVLRAGLVPVLVADRDPRAQVGRVSAQSPEAGTSLAGGSVVRLSTGGDPGTDAVDVPNVTGLVATEGSARLVAAGLRSQIVPIATQLPWAPRGTVVAQAPVGPTARARAATVTLWVAAP